MAKKFDWNLPDFGEQRMNHCVPDWDIEDAPIPSLSGFSPNVEKKSAMPDDELVELLWRDGQPVMHSQTQRSSRKSPEDFPGMDAVPLDRPEKFISDHRKDIRSVASHLFIQEDEMASWLHYSLDDSEFCTDFFNPIHGSAAGNVSGVRNLQIPVERKAVSVVAPVEKALPESFRPLNFQHFSLPGMSRRGFPAVEVSGNAARVSRFGSDEIPARGSENYASFVPELRISGGGSRGVSGSAVAHVSFNVGGVQMVGEGSSKGCASSCAVTDAGAHTCEGIEATVSCSSTAEQNAYTVADDRKRKARETDESECQSQEREFESLDPKKVARQTSMSTRKTRAAEVHNLSERRRRDRINEKMKALQQLIPRCNKSDKASMLDDAIEYLKSLQLQVQMMSMGCCMPPMMFPGVQHYMSPMGMGMGMGLGMGMGMERPVGLNRPILSFPQVLPSSAGPGPAPPHLGPRIPVPAFHLHPIHQTDQSQVQATNQVNHALNMVNLQNLNQMQAQNIVDPYQHYIGLHPMQVTPQNQVPAQPSMAKGAETPPERKSG